MKNVLPHKEFFYALSLLFMLFFFGCSSSDKIDPDEWIKESYQNSQQVALIDTEDRQL